MFAPAHTGRGSARHMTMTFSRTVRCHYSFMHENLLDMNHQFLHRGVLGRIRPETPRRAPVRGLAEAAPAARPDAGRATGGSPERRARLGPRRRTGQDRLAASRADWSDRR
ncbi:phenylpropionate dioxygenase-like ring-hydroxylating dioxygenase large terminal subunit [Streptomyces sp. B4I13]|nr:phenylpropionate dioxygenase-like ring-hydroxylating dioxygenase large terminal subunit [Streptomyces sp. B4I13]